MTYLVWCTHSADVHHLYSLSFNMHVVPNIGTKYILRTVHFEREVMMHDLFLKITSTLCCYGHSLSIKKRKCNVYDFKSQLSMYSNVRLKQKSHEEGQHPLDIGQMNWCQARYCCQATVIQICIDNLQYYMCAAKRNVKLVTRIYSKKVPRKVK